MEVLEPAVANSEANHGLELLGDNRLGRVHEDAGQGQPRNQARKGLAFGRWKDVVPEADVDLDRNSRPCEFADNAQADATVGLCFAHRLDLDSRRIERDAVIGELNTADRGEEIGDRSRLWIAMTEKVEVAGGSKRVLGPSQEEHGALQDIALGRFGLAKPEEEALDRVPGQDALVVVSVSPGVLQEALPNRCACIAPRSSCHCIALTYGAMRLVTRSTAANSITSLMVVLRWRRASRSASMATSSPTCRRCLKQSAIVFATL